MNDAARLWYPPMIIAAAVILSRRWPRAMRRLSRCLAAVNGLALISIIATGWLHSAGPVASAPSAHSCLSHGLFVLDWSAVPLAIGVASARPRRRPIATAARVLGLLALFGALFLGSITGYLGPSQGPLDAMSFRRFQVLHYWVWPLPAIALVIWWYCSPTAVDPAVQCGTPDL
jgi:hypothetical protein